MPKTPRLQIIFATRTHAQLSQAMVDLRLSNYSQVDYGLLASRDHMCTNATVYEVGKSDSSLLNCLCKVSVQKRKCEPYNAHVAELRTGGNCKRLQPLDIEDIVEERKRNSEAMEAEKVLPCPFFSSKHSARLTDVLFMPHNYLLDVVALGRSRELFKLQNSIVIIDEGHNIARTCEEAASFTFKISDICNTIEVVRYNVRRKVISSEPCTTTVARDKLAKVPQLCLRTDLKNLDTALQQLHAMVVELPLTPTVPLKPVTLMVLMTNLRKKTSINYDNVAMHLNALTSILSKENSLGLVNADQTALNRASVTAVHAALLLMFFPHSIITNKNGELPMELDGANQNENFVAASQAYLVTVADMKAGSVTDKVIHCHCLTPKPAMQALINRGIRSLIVTSGTMSPLQMFAAELGIPFQIQRTFPHVISPHQISSVVISSGPTTVSSTNAHHRRLSFPTTANKEDTDLLRADFKNMNNAEFHTKLGQTILSLLSCIPAGVLVFFSSYKYMKTCMAAWAGDIELRMRKIKTVFVECRDRDEFRNDLASFREHTKQSGAVFFAVCRGKLSEGINFSDDCARGVIIIGMPFYNLINVFFSIVN